MTVETVLVEYLVKVRDAANEALDQLAPSELRTAKSYNPENLKWIRATGPSGPYERFPAPQQKPQQTADYVNLLNDLKNHEGKLQHGGLFYWFFGDNITIGRKPAKQ